MDKNYRGDTFWRTYEVEYENEPYYASILFLADNFDESKLNELYVEEEI